MADSVLTLLELTKKRGTDAEVGLIEEITTYAPEIAVLRGRTIPSTQFYVGKRTTLATGAAFRNSNEGLDLTSSKYDKIPQHCYFFDCQLQVDESLYEGPETLADEASGAMMQQMIHLGAQVYTGTTNDSKGFAGIRSFVNSDLVINAGGSGSSVCQTVYLMYNNIKGAMLVFGNNQGVQMGEWTRQQVKDTNSKSFMAYVNNVRGWIGLQFAHTKCVGTIKNLNNTSTGTAKMLTDALIAECASKFPVGMYPTVGFARRDALFMLERSRMPVTDGQKSTSNLSSGVLPAWPQRGANQPVMSCGIPIYPTDSIALETNY